LGRVKSPACHATCRVDQNVSLKETTKIRDLNVGENYFVLVIPKNEPNAML
jgi:hypothetical protein